MLGLYAARRRRPRGVIGLLITLVRPRRRSALIEHTSTVRDARSAHCPLWTDRGYRLGADLAPRDRAAGFTSGGEPVDDERLQRH
jgi:hypothetical protein